MTLPANWTEEERRFFPAIGKVSKVKLFPSISMRDVKTELSMFFQAPNLLAFYALTLK
jgi:hypothetical protein